MDIVAYLGLRELILNLIQRNLSLFPYSCKQSPWEECLLTVMCFLQESSAMPHPGQGWQQGLVTQCQPWRWCWERSFSLHPRAWYRAHCGDGLCHHGQRWACCKSSSALAPRLCHCLQEPVPGWGHVAHNCPETKPAVLLKREQWEGGNRKMLHKGLLKWVPDIWHDSSESLVKSVLPLCASQALYLHFSYNIILPSHEKVELFLYPCVIRLHSVTNTEFLTSGNWCHL